MTAQPDFFPIRLDSIAGLRDKIERAAAGLGIDLTTWCLLALERQADLQLRAAALDTKSLRNDILLRVIDEFPDLTTKQAKQVAHFTSLHMLANLPGP